MRLRGIQRGRMVQTLRGLRIRAISAERATPKHMLEPMSCTTSTL
jgi:hypothetical protein